MKKLFVTMAVSVALLRLNAGGTLYGSYPDQTETIGGVTWKYSIITNGGSEVAVIGLNQYRSVWCGPMVFTTPQGFSAPAEINEFVIPRSLGSVPVWSVGPSTFVKNTQARTVVIPEGVEIIAEGAFTECSNLEEITFPSTLKRIDGDSSYVRSAPFYGCNKLKSLLFKGAPPQNFGFTDLISRTRSTNARIYYPRKFGAQWQTAVEKERFLGFQEPNTNRVEIVSTSVRDTDPSILDVTFKVHSDKSKVRVRAVAYLDGIRSFSNIVRINSLVDGTGVYVGDSVTPNEEHTISWRAKDDLDLDLAHVSVEVLAVEDSLLPMEMMRIPAVAEKKVMEISWNVHTKEQVFDALLWLYADKMPGLTLKNGVLYGDEKPLLTGTEFYTVEIKQDPYMPEYTYEDWTYRTDAAIGFVFKSMGYGLLKGAELDYANKMTRLGLVAPDPYYGEKSYAYRWVE